MANLNKTMLIGNLTRDPEIKYTPKGTAVASFGIATNRNYTTESGEKREEVTFIECEAYARLAEIVGEYCKKGRSIFIEGRLKLDQWEDKVTGDKRSKMKVVVENLQMLGSRGGISPEQAEQADAAAAAKSRPTPPPAPPADNKEVDDIPF